MGKLTGPEITKRVSEDRLIIKPFDESRVNPNSYNLAIGPKLLVYQPRYWFTPWRKPLVWGQLNPPDYAVDMNAEKGFVIKPGWFYLGSTVEHTKTSDLVPILDGRSSTGRLSLHIHATAGFGDVGFEGCWTLELYSIIPVRIFPFTPICQISYDIPEGELLSYKGLYRGYSEPVSYQPSVNGRR
jgi:dCTP deaminase